MKVEFSIELDFFITYIILLSIFAPPCGIALGALEVLEALGVLGRECKMQNAKLKKKLMANG